ncbi:hypothetical protein, partial [Vibrio vulnificus]|uniref:hypothetical protein n=1 Tax=Vibrio vulnificus TaxID=672 RepID=UPI0024DFD32B
MTPPMLVKKKKLHKRNHHHIHPIALLFSITNCHFFPFNPYTAPLMSALLFHAIYPNKSSPALT